MVLLPEGGQLSVAELRDVAARQQQQIEAQQQLLVAKEQRLKFLKQQHQRQLQQGQQQGHEPEQRLRALRDRVQMQELKLRRLRQLRGQVDQQHANNANLSAELDSIRALFSEKEKELSVAVAKVEELTRQLEDVRRSNHLQGSRALVSPTNAAHELDKLRKELMVRAQLTEQQSVRIAQQREALSRRQGEVADMDRRIGELQQRLLKKRLHNQALQAPPPRPPPPRAPPGPPPLRRGPNVAAVEPLQRGPPPSKKDPKYQTLPYNTKFCLKPRPECTVSGVQEQGPEESPEPDPKKQKSPEAATTVSAVPGSKPPEPQTKPPPPEPSPEEPPAAPTPHEAPATPAAPPAVNCRATAPSPVVPCPRASATQIPVRLRPAAVASSQPVSPVVTDFRVPVKGASAEQSCAAAPSSVGEPRAKPKPSVPPKPQVPPKPAASAKPHPQAETSSDDLDAGTPQTPLEPVRTPPPAQRHVPKPPLQRPTQLAQPRCSVAPTDEQKDLEVSEEQPARTEGDGGTHEELAASDTESGEEQRAPCPASTEAPGARKGNLKTQGSTKNPHRVSFDPLALLLDAALEGELELVKKTALEVPNPSAANDEGITALHNAICAGHFDIVKFLVEFGCDVNAQDSDGWTPLHCAASCNNLAMVKFLVEHGACIFAATLSDHETAAEKCEEDEEGFDNCSEYLYSVQEKLGILHGGVAYGVFAYEAHNPDELSFQEGDMVLVLRKGDDAERHWWWARLGDREGYLPRNLLGLYPRVKPCREVDPADCS
ncbi:LOW QUALITY PROTEIN: apoptosis-stimulating of p53 protein 1 [Ixodes scapularis]|uniref:LOW QUALITY PROTEIN: apoptosis-stimulating of p53 protein 1 n=1 Tax=Ixodes scapularis TaxID=6945 RepID=UPI001C386FC0|nr:LOW QUALITY PROTEIN: apoptosis-stimulating of p53 protein 1 [Ixodes scapularis]